MADMIALTFDRSRERWSESTGLVKESVPVPTLLPDERVLHVSGRNGRAFVLAHAMLVESVLSSQGERSVHIRVLADDGFSLAERHISPVKQACSALPVVITKFQGLHLEHACPRRHGAARPG